MYNLMKRIITVAKAKNNLNIAEITERLDTFYAVGKLTTEQYEELTAVLTAEYK